MTTKIDITEFRNRLKENTKIGSPELKIEWGILSIIFADNSKIFYGKFDNSTFEITKNSNFFSSFYLLKGTYKNEKKLTINYSIEPISKLGNAWIKYFPIMGFIMCNSVFYFQAKPPIEIYVIFNAFLVFISIFSRVIIKLQNKNMEQKFIEIFEIEKLDK
ncbi:hypothetical protein [Flavobacterium anhuiense]|uniref:hypothetical protein n=1 Tax=Flavobacterium anhuiense TaxID=459526 RepID=UPI003D978E67